MIFVYAVKNLEFVKPLVQFSLLFDKRKMYNKSKKDKER